MQFHLLRLGKPAPRAERTQRESSRPPRRYHRRQGCLRLGDMASGEADGDAIRSAGAQVESLGGGAVIRQRASVVAVTPLGASYTVGQPQAVAFPLLWEGAADN